MNWIIEELATLSFSDKRLNKRAQTERHGTYRKKRQQRNMPII